MILVLIDFDGVIVDTKKKSKIIFTKCLRKIKRCKDNNLINYLYKKVDGLDILAISKYLGNYFKNDYLFFYKFLTTEWENVYKKTVLKKKTLEFFEFLNHIDAKQIIFSSSDQKNVNKVINQKLKKIDYLKKEFDKNIFFSKTTIDKINNLKKGCDFFINIDDNKFINRELTKKGFISLFYNIKDRKSLKDFFIETLFKKKINFYYNLRYKRKKISLIKSHFLISNVDRKKSLKNFNKIKEKNVYDGNLCFLEKIKFRKQLDIFGFNDKYSLRFLSKYLSLAVQGYITINKKFFLLGKRKNVICEKNYYEFLPSGGLEIFSYDFLLDQIKKECLEEIGLKITKRDISIIGLFFDFDQSLVDFCFNIKLNDLSKIRKNINYSDEHFLILIKQKNFLKKNFNKFTNTSKKIITNHIFR